MRLSRVSVQVAVGNGDEDGSAWIVVSTTRQGGDGRQDSVGFDQKSARERAWVHVATSSRVHTPPATLRTPCPSALTAFGMTLAEVTFSELLFPVASVKRAYTNNAIWPKQPKQRLVVSNSRRTCAIISLTRRQPFLLALAPLAVKHHRELTSTSPSLQKRPQRNPSTTTLEHTMLESRKRKSRSP